MPAIGLGTGGYGAPGNIGGEYWDNSVSYTAVKNWIALGGKRIDTSNDYNTELGVATAIKASSIDRKDLFITSKVGPRYPLGFDETIKQTMDILYELNTDYVDLLLIHWPGVINGTGLDWPCLQQRTDYKVCRKQSWLALEKMFKEGKARAIGVSNYEKNHLQEIFDLKSLLPAVNQVEYHPYWHEDDLVSFCSDHKIVFNGYSSVGVPDYMKSPDNPNAWKVQIIEQPLVQQIAQKYNKTAAQVVLQWSWKRGIVVNARSLDPVHQLENLNFFDIPLTPSELEQIASSLPLPPNPKVCPNPNEINKK
jgi:diketogulonate reductase-like aldo/keto reductase